MKLASLLARETSLPTRLLAIAALGSSLATVLVLALVNRAAQEIAESGIDEVDWPLAALFAGCLLLYASAELFLLNRMARHVEWTVDRVRVRLMTLLRRVELEALERLGQSRLFESITQSTHVISQNSQYIAIAFRSLVLAAVLLAYILYVSRLAFVLVLVVVLVAGRIYHRKGGELLRSHGAAQDQEKLLFERTTDQLDGWKEVRMSRARRDALRRDFDETAETASHLRITTQEKSFEQFIFGQVAFYFLLGTIVFVVPRYSQIFADDLVEITTAVLFLIAPVGLVIQSVAVLSAAEAAADRMLKLEGELAELSGEQETAARPAVKPLAGFQEIRLVGAEYSYAAEGEEHPFRLGPVDITLRRGEIVFVSGGNGSGKSTLIRLLTGLVRPQAGRLEVDGRRVGPAGLRAYRALVAAVLSDFHLFHRLHGLEASDPDRVEELLTYLGLDGIVSLRQGSFNRTELSAGQRKRLALAVALLEERPLLVLDEWAADQDPQFRRRFYREILPELRDSGLTILAVTHDDHYFDAADRRIHLEEGRVVELVEGDTAKEG